MLYEALHSVPFTNARPECGDTDSEVSLMWLVHQVWLWTDHTDSSAFFCIRSQFIPLAVA